MQRRLAVGATQIPMSNVRILTNLCMSDMFDRYPNLQVVSAESGIGSRIIYFTPMNARMIAATSGATEAPESADSMSSRTRRASTSVTCSAPSWVTA